MEIEGKMSPDACRLCSSSRFKPEVSIEDENIGKFLKLTIVTLSADPSLPSKCCDSCVTKVKAANDFIQSVLELQNELNMNVANTSSAGAGSTKESSRASQDVTKSISSKSNLNVRGITIKKISSPPESMLYDPIHVDIKGEPADVLCIKEEPFDVPTLDMFNEDSSSYASEIGVEVSDDDDDDDDDYNERKTTKPKQRPSQRQTIENLSFTCAKCKRTYADFETLTVHITSKVCNKREEKMECKRCGREFRSAKSLHNHSTNYCNKPLGAKLTLKCKHCSKVCSSELELKNHNERHMRVLRKDFTFRCNQCDAKFNSHKDLFDHMKQHAKTKSKNKNKVLVQF